jgi:hypothetical protein
MLVAGVGVAMLAGAVTDTHATRFTEEAEFYLRSLYEDGGGLQQTDGPPITAIELQAPSGGGSLFTNTFSALAPDGSVSIRTVGIDRLTSYSDDPNGGNVAAPLLGNAYVIFALEGSANLAGGGALANFTSGKAIVISRLGGGFQDNDPSTWSYAGLAGANVLAIYDLAAPEAVTKGPNGDIAGSFPGDTIPASEVNFSAINTGSSALNQGIFLFDFASNGAGLVSPDFQINQNPVGLPGTEGLLVISDQSNPQTSPVGFDAADEAVLNTIMMDLVGGLRFSDVGSLVEFYTPGVVNVGDFYNEFGFNANPVSRSAIPEPATVVLALGGLAGLLVRRRRLA